MKIAFTAKGSSWDSQIDPRFGRTEFLVVFDDENKSMTFKDNREGAEEAHGVGTKTAKDLIESGAKVLITGNGPGSNAAKVLEQAQIEIFVGADSMNVEEALSAYYNGTLNSFNLYSG